MHELGPETELLFTIVGDQPIAFALDDIVRISLYFPDRESVERHEAAFASGEGWQESEERANDPDGDATIDDDDADPVRTLDLTQHLNQVHARPNCVLECSAGNLLVANAGIVLPLGDQLVCPLPELIREAGQTIGIEQLIWDESREQWRFLLASDRLLKHVPNSASADAEEEAA